MKPENEPLILIVDDEPINLKLLFTELKEAGFKVLVAQDGESALEKLHQVSPHLILLDIKMPIIDGFETCRRLKKSPQTSQIPVIFMSALNDVVDKVQGLQLGAVDYITKPFEQAEVIARIQMHLRVQNLTQELERQNALLKQEIAARTVAEIALETLNKELEQRVAQRTAELTRALQELQKTQVELLEREAKLGHVAFHDALTDLPNRAWLMSCLKHAIALAAKYPDYHYAVLFIDLDRFKLINDSFGHLLGDELLKTVAGKLQDCLRYTDTIARFGGDEFVILLEHIQDNSEVTRVVERIQVQLREPLNLGECEICTEVSIGIILGTNQYERPEDVLRDADAAMYQAKAKGRGRYEVFDPMMQTLAIERLQLEHDLRRAIALQEFCLFYQPIVSLSSLKVTGFEALVRWNHPLKGWVCPASFIPVAEETGLIHDLGWWILEAACQQLKQWQQQFSGFPLTMNVNFSAIQLKQVNLLYRLEEILEQSQISPAHLKLEITESCILETIGWEEKILKQLRHLGIELCIDDFGTGYSSLSRLHEFPINTLKIDRSFVQEIGPDESHLEIIRTIIMLARIRRMNVVAEGIETITQLKKLRKLGCEQGQGYLLSPPVDSVNATKFLLNPEKLQERVNLALESHRVSAS